MHISSPSFQSQTSSLRSILFAAMSLVALLFFSMPAASAVTFSLDGGVASGNPLDAQTFGDQFTIDITLRSDGEGILGILASVSGYDRNIVRFVSGSASLSLFDTACIPGSYCFGGLLNERIDLVEEDGRVVFADALTHVPVTNSGANDRGVDGNLGGPQARFTFEMIGLGTTTLSVGTDGSAGEAVIGAAGTPLSTNNNAVSVAIIPEPSSVLLMGLGLASLSRAQGSSRNRSPFRDGLPARKMESR